MNGLFALIDCNNFYVSCERAFNPRLEGKPVAVLSNNDGCVIARSNELKELGCEMGAPFFKMRDFFRRHDVVVLSSNYTLYGDMSRRVMQVLDEQVPELEVYSIDEAFAQFPPLPPDERIAFARRLRADVLRCTGIPVGIGVAPTKVLAKLANKFAKQAEGAFDFTDHPQLDDLLAQVPVKAIWGVGKQHTKLLEKHGIMTAADMREVSPSWARQNMTVVGERLVRELRGESCLPLDEVREPRKAIGCSRMFATRRESLEDLEEAAAMYATRAAEKLRSQGSLATLLEVMVTTGKHAPGPQYTNTASWRFPVPTADSSQFVAAARRGVREIWKPGYQYTKAGIQLLGLVPNDAVQQDLFASAQETGEQSKREKRDLAGLLDRINGKWGRAHIRLAAEGTDQQWHMQRNFLTQRYTTRWDELLEVN